MYNVLKYSNGLLDHFFNSCAEEGRYSPAADIVETENGYTLQLDVPGFEEKDLSIEVKKGYLLVSGTVQEEKKDEKKKYVLKESCRREFTRSFKLPERTDPEKIEAKLTNGVLNIGIKLHEEAQPKKININ